MKILNLNLNSNNTLEILSPLDQFEIREYLSLYAPILGNINISITNIGFYLTIGGFIILILTLINTNFNKIIVNK
jgi:hypothetical protein